eukprot:754959-Pelagomonas_calceolata.AAC.1
MANPIANWTQWPIAYWPIQWPIQWLIKWLICRGHESGGAGLPMVTEMVELAKVVHCRSGYSLHRVSKVVIQEAGAVFWCGTSPRRHVRIRQQSESCFLLLLTDLNWQLWGRHAKGLSVGDGSSFLVGVAGLGNGHGSIEE